MIVYFFILAVALPWSLAGFVSSQFTFQFDWYFMCVYKGFTWLSIFFLCRGGMAYNNKVNGDSTETYMTMIMINMAKRNGKKCFIRVKGNGMTPKWQYNADK